MEIIEEVEELIAWNRSFGISALETLQNLLLMDKYKNKLNIQDFGVWGFELVDDEIQDDQIQNPKPQKS